MKTYRIFFLDHRTYCINSLGDSLSQMGHKIMYQASWVDKEIEAGIAYFKPDILITVGYNGPLFNRFSDIIPELCKKYKILHLYWATEDLINHSDWSFPYVSRAKPDLVWTIHPLCIEKYAKLGIPASYFNFGFNPRIFPAKKKSDVELYDIALVGATHMFKRTYRFDSFKHLLFPFVNEGHKVYIWGYGWRKDRRLIKREFGEVVPIDWLQGHLLYGYTSRVYRSSRILLGIQNAEDQVTQRTFEILGSGGFMIASRTQGIMELFDDKKEVMLTSSPEETLEIANYYLPRHELRLKIGEKARKKVMAMHTYHKKIHEVWSEVEGLMKKKLGSL